MTRRISPKGGVQPVATTASICKTCRMCRLKKIKCDSTQPQCTECFNSDTLCVYPRDARRQPRPSQARVESLEATVAAMLEHMKASGMSLPQGEAFAFSGLRQENQPSSSLSVTSPSPVSTTATRELPNIEREPQRMDTCHTVEDNSGEENENVPSDSHHAYEQHPTSQAAQLLQHSRPPSSNLNIERDLVSKDMEDTMSLSPCEARVAGVYHEEGCVASVHGLSGIINPTLRATHKENISKISRMGEKAIAMTRARLVSNAALQRQYESSIFRNPRKPVDMDSCDPELAKHLLDLHFSRQDYPNIILYRPAVMGSIAKSGRPWINKLLLNAVFYSSSLCSDRECFSSSQGPKDKGQQFYDRFRYLLVEEMGQASIPTATALLLMSTTLISRGKITEGWNMSGMAYRMVIDLGCHLMLAPDYQAADSRSNGQNLHRDMEQEMRKRLYWGAYITDVMQSLFLGRPCMFATVEARVPLQFLDEFEEMDEWQPYNDPLAGVNLIYEPQSAHTISTFVSLARMAQIGKTISELYDISVMKNDTKRALDIKTSIEHKLEEWCAISPKLSESGTTCPPPHQITPHTTYHVLRILLYRAFMEEGHLRRHSDLNMKRQCEECCTYSAMMISRHVQTYREAFTLRRAPFLLSYAVYSAVTVILRHARHDRSQFIETISFLWQCLGELQEGCNFGLQRPMSILRDMVQEFRQSHQAGLSTDVGQDWPDGGLDKSLFPNLPLGQDFTSGSAISPMSLGTWSDGPFDYPTALDQVNLGLEPSFLTNDEWTISQNDLYGLFAP